MRDWQMIRLCVASLAFVAMVRASQAQGQFSSADFNSMTFALGRYPTTPGCGRGCVDFIVARGKIGPLSYFQLLFALKRAGDKPIPVVLHSPGGLIAGGVEMANILKLQGYPVMIARATALDCDATCTPEDKSLGVLPYTLDAETAECSSACAMTIAGATEIILPDGASIGVHRGGVDQDVLPFKLDKDIIKQAENNILRNAENFYTAMAISKDIMPLLRETPNATMRYLTEPELRRFGFKIRTLEKAPTARIAE